MSPYKFSESTLKKESRVHPERRCPELNQPKMKEGLVVLVRNFLLRTILRSSGTKLIEPIISREIKTTTAYREAYRKSFNLAAIQTSLL
jgi:hypothetical protein